MNIFIERYLIFWYTLNCKMVFIYNIKKDFKIKGVKMSKGQSNRLTKQQIEGQGPISIFHKEAYMHDKEVNRISMIVMNKLKQEFPKNITTED